MTFGGITDSNGKTISGYNPITTSLIFTRFFEMITFGVNGAVSVNHLSQLLTETKN